MSITRELKMRIRKRGAAVRRVWWRSGSNRFCPVCEQLSRRFAPYGISSRPDAQCPSCGALERHRLVWLYFLRVTDLFDGRRKRVLHVAPEPCFEARLISKLKTGYLTADIDDSKAMIKMDITATGFPDHTFDVIYCSHVLEHVADDAAALREFFRILKPSGWALLQVPITVKKTIEDSTITDPAERLRLFGHKDHVRRYGFDYVDRLYAAGFRVNVVKAEEFNESRIIENAALAKAGEIFHCVKS